MRVREQVSGQRSEAAKTVRYEHAILPSALSNDCAQKRCYVKAASSPGLHKSPVDVLLEVLLKEMTPKSAFFVVLKRYKNHVFGS